MCTNETLYIMQRESKFVVQEYSEVTEVGPLQDECVFRYVEKVGRLEEYGRAISGEYTSHVNCTFIL